jgi:hypothetical protein
LCDPAIIDPRIERRPARWIRHARSPVERVKPIANAIAPKRLPVSVAGEQKNERDSAEQSSSRPKRMSMHLLDLIAIEPRTSLSGRRFAISRASAAQRL